VSHQLDFIHIWITLLLQKLGESERDEGAIMLKGTTYESKISCHVYRYGVPDYRLDMSSACSRHPIPRVPWSVVML